MLRQRGGPGSVPSFTKNKKICSLFLCKFLPLLFLFPCWVLMDFNRLKNVKISGAFARFSLITQKTVFEGEVYWENYAP
jgi:hypothetical protein